MPTIIPLTTEVYQQKARKTFTCNFRQFSGEKNPQTPMVTTFFTLYYVPTDPKPKTESVMIHSLHPKNPLFTTLPDINPLLLSNITNTELGGSSGSSIRGRSNQSGSDIQRWQCFYQRASFICHLRRTHGAAPHPRPQPLSCSSQVSSAFRASDTCARSANLPSCRWIVTQN